MTGTKTSTLVGIAVALFIVAALLVSLSANTERQRVASITNFDECAAAGYPIMESYPEQCRTSDGRTFVRDVSSSDGLGLQANGCAVAGCSGQLCVSAEEAGDIVTTCEFRAEYACYREASCEPQADGQCGWTETPELKKCLANPPALDAEVTPSF
jgi:eight-cysteine-cluster-containing protein